MKKFIIGFVIGALLFSSITAFAVVKVAEPSTWKFFVDGEPREIEAYSIDGSNFLKLRDVFEIADIGVWAEGESRSVYIERDKGYDAGYEGPGKGSEVKVEVEENAKDEEDNVAPKKYRDLTTLFIISNKTYIDGLRAANIVEIDKKTYISAGSILLLIAIADNGYEITESLNPYVDGQLDITGEYFNTETFYTGITETKSIITFSRGNYQLILDNPDDNDYYKIIDGSNHVDMETVKNKLFIDFDYSINESENTITFTNIKSK